MRYPTFVFALLFCLLSTLLGAATTVAAQSASLPSFEAAVIKDSAPPSMTSGGRITIRSGCNGGPGTDDPGRLTCEFENLSDFVIRAYGIKPYQLTALDWMTGARFDITATIPAGTTAEQEKLMEQNLLATRFGLTLHHVNKELPEYALSVAKGGPKLKQALPDDTSAGTAAEPPAPARGPGMSAMTMGPDGRPVMPKMPPGGQMMMMSPQGMTMNATAMSMDGLTTFLARQMSSPVVDSTGLKGKYDISLNFSSEGLPEPSGGVRMGMMSAMAAPVGGGTNPALTDALQAPPLLAALQAQLGLKLDKSKGMVDTIVVDRCEKEPTAN